MSITGINAYSPRVGFKANSPKQQQYENPIDRGTERNLDVLKGIKGRFLLSYDDSPKIRELYKGFEMVEVERQNGINNRQGTDRTNKIYKELLIANYPIKANVSRG